MQPTEAVCTACGATVVPEYTPDSAPDEPGAFLCYRHKRAVTRLRCGRCGRAICPDCAMIGPAGPRCPDCGRNKVPIRGRAVAYEFKSFFRGIFQGPFRFWIIIVLAGMLIGLAQSCFDAFSKRGPAPVETQEQTD